MIPFYYKGVLFFEEAKESVYSRGIYILNDLEKTIRNEKNLQKLDLAKADYAITFAAPIDSKYGVIAKIAYHGEKYGFYSRESGKIVYPTVERLLNAMPKVERHIPRLTNKYANLILKGEKTPNCNMLSPELSALWTENELRIKRSGIDIITETADARLILSFNHFVDTPGKLADYINTRTQTEKTNDKARTSRFQEEIH